MKLKKLFKELQSAKLLDKNIVFDDVFKLLCDTLNENEIVEDICINEIQRIKAEGYTFINDGHDFVLILKDKKIESYFYVGELFKIWYDEKIHCLMAMGHETVHRYHIPTKDYKSDVMW